MTETPITPQDPDIPEEPPPPDAADPEVDDQPLGPPADMPEEWRQGLTGDETRLARRVADYIAGMTDRFAILEHRRLFATTPDLR